MIYILLCLAVAIAATSITPVNSGKGEPMHDDQWVQAVEGILAQWVLGPLKPEFTPAFLSQRTRESILNAQRTHFRAYVARLLMQSLAPEGLIYVEPPPEIAPEVVEAQVAELRAHSFSVRWLARGVGGAFVVNVPKTP
jgi:hypothetical protein